MLFTIGFCLLDLCDNYFAIQELLTLLIHWQHKTGELFERSKKVVPVQLRTEKLKYYRPVQSLCDFKTNEVCC